MISRRPIRVRRDWRNRECEKSRIVKLTADAGAVFPGSTVALEIWGSACPDRPGGRELSALSQGAACYDRTLATDLVVRLCLPDGLLESANRSWRASNSL